MLVEDVIFARPAFRAAIELGLEDFMQATRDGIDVELDRVMSVAAEIHGEPVSMTWSARGRALRRLFLTGLVDSSVTIEEMQADEFYEGDVRVCGIVSRSVTVWKSRDRKAGNHMDCARNCRYRTVTWLLSIFVILAGVLSVVESVRAATDPRDADLIVLAGTLIDGTGARPRRDAALVVRNGYISEILPAAEIAMFDRDRVVDGRDATVLPGFINAHAHVRTWFADYGEHWTREGVTTLANLASVLEETDDYRYYFGWNISPHLLVSGPMVTVSGGYPAPVWGEQIAYYVRGPENASARTQSLIDVYGVDLIKISVSSFRPGWARLSVPEIRAIVDTAHANGLRVLAHVDRLDDYRRAVEGGVDTLAHIPFEHIPDELLQQGVDQGLVIVPTFQVQIGNNRARRSAAYENARRFRAMGGILALGDDVGNPNIRPGMPFFELEAFRDEVGLSEHEIIVAGTRSAATALGIENVTGTLELGRRADILIVRGDPLTELDALRDVLFVIKGGRLAYRHDEAVLLSR